MSLTQELKEYVAAGYTGLWLRTLEPEGAEEALVSVANDMKFQICKWDFANHWTTPRGAARDTPNSETPLEAILGRDRGSLQKLSDFLRHVYVAHTTLLGVPGDTMGTIVILENCHRKDVMQDLPTYPQLLQNLILAGRASHLHIVMMSPVVNLPIELEHYFTVVEHKLPTKEELLKVAGQLATDSGEELKAPSDPEERRKLAAAAAGMTRLEAENAFALTLVRGKPFNPGMVWEQKALNLAKTGLLQLYSGPSDLKLLGGVDYVTQFSRRLLESREDPELYAKGLLLLGVPGGGKSEFIRALGNNSGRRVLEMNVGSLRSKWQGETDHNVKRALETADAMSPCILMIDECEKALAGVASSGQTDGGTGARLFGTLLTWMNDHKSDVLVACTCNNLRTLLDNNPEFARAERFDATFFFDLPDDEARESIWDIYLRKYFSGVKGIKVPQLVEMSEGWTGAEIKAAARLSRIQEHPLYETDTLIVPVSTTSDIIHYTREWAAGKCLDASKPGLYRFDRKLAAQVPNLSSQKRKLSLLVKTEKSEDERSVVKKRKLRARKNG
jgi:hypothetical protein